MVDYDFTVWIKNEDCGDYPLPAASILKLDFSLSLSMLRDHLAYGLTLERVVDDLEAHPTLSPFPVGKPARCVVNGIAFELVMHHGYRVEGGFTIEETEWRALNEEKRIAEILENI